MLLLLLNLCSKVLKNMSLILAHKESENYEYKASGGWTLLHLFNPKKGGLITDKIWCEDDISDDGSIQEENDLKMYFISIIIVSRFSVEVREFFHS